MKQKKINIALIDDHQLLSKSLSNLLEKNEFIGTVKVYKSPKEYFRDDPDIDIIISDLLMPEMNGIDLLAELKKRNDKTGVIMLSSIIEVQTIRHALRNGASGYLSKDSSPEELAEAILAVYDNDTYVGESLRKSLIMNAIVEDRFVYSLSPREREVLNLVCSGKTIKETAGEMNLSINTVQTYHKNILKKFNLNRTADLIVFAMQNGLYNPQSNG